MFKLLIRLVILAVAVGGPMLFFKTDDLVSGVKKTIAALKGQDGAEATPHMAGKPILPPTSGPMSIPLEGAAVGDLAEIFRFDVTTGWILGRWPSVSTGLAQLQLQGYRVPLVTGTKANDLAGSLTYYFDPQQQVQVITFNGTTGDPTRLAQLLVSRYGFLRRVANDGGLILFESPDANGQARGTLQIRLAGLVKSDQPFRRFQVDLTLPRHLPKS